MDQRKAKQQWEVRPKINSIQTSGGEVSMIELPYKGKTFTVQQSWPRNKWYAAIEPSNGLNTADYDTVVEAIAAAKAIVDEERSEGPSTPLSRVSGGKTWTRRRSTLA